MNPWPPLKLHILGAFALLFTPFVLSAQVNLTASVQWTGKDQKKVVVANDPDPALKKIIEEEEFFWKDDNEELVLPQNEVDPTVLPKVDTYRESFLDSDSNMEEWAAPNELDSSDSSGS